jgi:hypothetical protein
VVVLIDDVFRYGGGDDPGQDLRKMMTEVKQTDHGPDIFKQVGCSKRTGGLIIAAAVATHHETFSTTIQPPYSSTKG